MYYSHAVTLYLTSQPAWLDSYQLRTVFHLIQLSHSSQACPTLLDNRIHLLLYQLSKLYLCWCQLTLCFPPSEYFHIMDFASSVAHDFIITNLFALMALNFFCWALIYAVRWWLPTFSTFVALRLMILSSPFSVIWSLGFSLMLPSWYLAFPLATASTLLSDSCNRHFVFLLPHPVWPV